MINATQPFVSLISSLARHAVIVGLAVFVILLFFLWPSSIWIMGSLALGYLAYSHAAKPNLMLSMMGHLETQLPDFQMVDSSVFSGRTSPMLPDRDFTITFVSDASVARIRTLLIEYFSERLKFEIHMTDSGNFRTKDENGSRAEYEVFLRGHDEMEGIFRIRVTKI